MPRARFFSAADQPDRIALLEALGRHTRFVRWSKVLLIAFILALLGTVVVLPILRGDTAGVRIAFSPSAIMPDAASVMRRPRYQGADAKGQPYTVTAESAIQQDADTVILTNVQGDALLKDQTWLSLNAQQGTLKLSQQKLYLIGGVQIFYNGGYEMRSERIAVDLAANLAHGDMPLEGQGNIGYIQARAFTAYDRGQRFVFDGPVRVRIYPGRKE